MLPFLVASIVSEKGYPYYFKMARIWQNSFSLNGIYYKIESQVLEPDKSYMIVANHTSMTDIMLMLATVKSPLFSLEK
jgi:1-acyl-sn-glycerol-3-phosphate acyltransferase